MTVVLIIIAVIAIYAVFAYNSLITLKNRVENGWAQIDTQLQRRYDLIPNLVETVKGYAAHEKEVFDRVTQARAGMAKANTVAEKADADNVISGTLKSLFAVAENYPDLKANENFRELQLELTNTENKISFSRQFYNDTVTRFNTAIQTFPKNVFASIFKFKEFEYFEISNEDVRNVPQVKF